MRKIVPIVEGDGEVAAVPKLLYKILVEMGCYDVQIAVPKNAHGCTNLIKPGGLERFVQLAWMEYDCAAVLILMDADENCPSELAAGFTKRVLAMGSHRSVVSVIANYEYEAWFLASLETIAGKDLDGRIGLPVGLQSPNDPEKVRNPKQWLTDQWPRERSYKETFDQAPMTQLIDTTLAKKHSRSFRRLWSAMKQVLEAIDSGETIVTPQVEKAKN